jgi:zinc protease
LDGIVSLVAAHERALGARAGERWALANGAAFVFRSRRLIPAVTIQASVRAGSTCELAGQAGLSHFMSRLLGCATARRPADTIAETLDTRGALLDVKTSHHLLTVSCTCLAEHFSEMFDLVVDILKGAEFADSEFSRRRDDLVAEVRQEQGRPASVATHAVLEGLYSSSHPYGRPLHGRVSKLSATERQHVTAFHQENCVTAGAIVVVAGDVDPGRIVTAAAQLDAWQPSVVRAPPGPPAAPPVGREERTIAVPGAVQAEIAYGFRTIRRDDIRYPAWLVMATALGQLDLGGRIGAVLRERLGLAYTAFCLFEPREWEGPLILRAGVSPARIARALSAMDGEVARMGEDGIGVGQLQACKQHLLGRLARRLATNAGTASFLREVEQHGLGADYERRFADQLRAVTRLDVNAAAHDALAPARANVAIAIPA